MESEILLRVDKLCKYFKGKNGYFKAVDDISFDVKRGEVFGLVGESGSGKTTAGRTIIGLHKPTSGDVYFDGQNLTEVKSRLERAKKMQMIFQDPGQSLNPRMTIGEIIAEGLKVNKTPKDIIEQEVINALQSVALSREHMDRYPHEFSGGQRQRMGIARAIVLKPQLIIADEPISALDVSIQAQVINLLQSLKQKLNLSILFIAHDLSVVKYFCDRIAVMYAGRIVEIASSEELFENALHDYTKSLLTAVPIPDPIIERRKERITFDGVIEGQLKEVTKGHYLLC